MMRRSGFLLSIIAFVFLVLLASGLVPEEYVSYAESADFFGIITVILVGGVTAGIALMEYHNYSISILEKNIKITRGILSRFEIGVPYRRIKQVDIVRTLTCRIFGISNIIITTVGDEDTSHTHDKIGLPYLEKHLAEKIQHEILQHAQVEQMRMVEHPTKTVA